MALASADALVEGDGGHMSIVSSADLETLIRSSAEPALSLYMPTHRAGDQVRQDPIRLKNLIDRAEEQLLDHGLRRPEVAAFVEPLHKLVPRHRFWQHQSDGLAVFLSPEVARYYRLPLDFEERVFVGDRFYLKPLLPLISGDGRYYVLALSQDEVRLLQGTRYSVGQVDLEDVPDNLAAALKWDDPERQLQWHTETGGQSDTVPTSGWRSVRRAIFHGHGVVEEDDSKEVLLRYFHMIDDGVSELLAGQRAPLVVAGVDYLHPLYADANTYDHLVEDGIVGNPEEWSAAELHERAWQIVQPVFERDRREALARYEQAAGAAEGLASDRLADIVPAAYMGRIDTLFVATEVERWGTFDADTNAVAALHAEPQPGDHGLLDLAAVQTLLNSGTVYAGPGEEVPGGNGAAAIFRYALDRDVLEVESS